MCRAVNIRGRQSDIKTFTLSAVTVQIIIIAITMYPLLLIQQNSRYQSVFFSDVLFVFHMFFRSTATFAYFQQQKSFKCQNVQLLGAEHSTFSTSFYLFFHFCNGSEWEKSSNPLQTHSTFKFYYCSILSATDLI